MSKRRISNIAGSIEYQPGKYRQISNLAANVEYRPGKYRQISNVALMVEYLPCIQQSGDVGYADWQFYLEKLTILRDTYGHTIDLSPWETCTRLNDLSQLRQLYIQEVTDAISDFLGFPYDPGAIP